MEYLRRLTGSNPLRIEYRVVPRRESHISLSRIIHDQGFAVGCGTWNTEAHPTPPRLQPHQAQYTPHRKPIPSPCRAHTDEWEKLPNNALFFLVEAAMMHPEHELEVVAR